MNNYAFIDGTNLYKSIDESGWRLDYRKFRIYLRDKYRVTTAYMFYGYHSQYDNIYNFLKRAGFELIFKPTTKKSDGKIKGNVDAEFVLTVRDMINEFDKAIIVAGDGDYRCLVSYLKEKDKLLKILIPNKNKYSALLREYAEYFDYMNNLSNKLQYIKFQ